MERGSQNIIFNKNLQTTKYSSKPSIYSGARIVPCKEKDKIAFFEQHLIYNQYSSILDVNIFFLKVI